MLGDDVFEWISRQPTWQRDLANRVAASVELDEAEYAEALKVVKHIFGVSADDKPQKIQAIERGDIAASPDAPVSRLLALGSLQGVGLVADTEELTFGSTGLTLIYGQNAVGKSSYVRALKAICRTVDRSCRVLNNVYHKGATPGRPSARIRLDTDGAVLERRTGLDGDAEVRLPGVSVFDTACAELYTNSQNKIEYIPAELRVLARLAVLQDRLRRDLASERAALEACEPARTAYPPTTEVGRSLASITGAASDPDLSALCALSEDQHRRMAELRVAIAATANSSVRSDALAARREAEETRALSSALTKLAHNANAVTAERLRRASAADTDAREALRLAAESLRGPVADLGGGPWRLMWDAAREFALEAGTRFPPSAGEHCPLCLQVVSIDTAERLAHFEAHVSSALQAKAEAASKDLENVLEECAQANADRCRAPLLAVLRERETDLAEHVEKFISGVAGHMAAMRSHPESAIGGSFDTELISKELVGWADSRAGHADALLAAEDPDKLKTLQLELAELDARERLAAELHIFEEWRTRLRVIGALAAAHSGLATNRITSVQRELTETAIGTELGTALEDELHQLSCTHLPVTLRTRTQMAETSARLQLLSQQQAGLSEIASEGERRALALSFFFAELSVTADTSGIIVDDPVSSLDEGRRDYISQRLVNEAKRRQVILFTHDLPFVFDVRDRAKKAGVPVHIQHIWRLGDDVGRVDDQPPFKAMELRKRIAKLEEELVAARNAPPPANYEEAWHRANGFYQRLRTSWERAVEERLFAGVIERFQRDVKTQQLKDVKLTDDLISQVDKGMSKSSRLLHEGAFAAQVELPSLPEMSADLDELRTFERMTRRANG